MTGDGEDTLAVHLKTVVIFMPGLLGDARHEYFVEVFCQRMDNRSHSS